MTDIKARRRARRIAQERGLADFANDTKWRKFFARAAGRIPLEVKLLYEDIPSPHGLVWIPAENYVEANVIGPELFVFIEWVRSEALVELQAAAAAVGLECQVRDGKGTIYGYR